MGIDSTHDVCIIQRRSSEGARYRPLLVKGLLID